MLDGPTDVTTGKEVTDRLHDALDAHGLDPERKDLASVLRLPGTTNHKATPIPVRIEYADGPRFTVAELVDALSGVPNETGGEGSPLLQLPTARSGPSSTRPGCQGRCAAP